MSWLQSMEKHICTKLQKFIEDEGYAGAVLELDGGIESTVAATLASNALGNSNVLGLILPYVENPDLNESSKTFLSQSHGFVIAEHLNINYEVVNVFNSLTAFNENDDAISRVKTMIKYYYADMNKYAVLDFTSLTDAMLGNFTKHAGSDFAMLINMHKKDIFDFARSINVPYYATKRNLSITTLNDGTKVSCYTVDKILYDINKMIFKKDEAFEDGFDRLCIERKYSSYERNLAEDIIMQMKKNMHKYKISYGTEQFINWRVWLGDDIPEEVVLLADNNNEMVK